MTGDDTSCCICGTTAGFLLPWRAEPPCRETIYPKVPLTTLPAAHYLSHRC
jgi:hypothetical protein